MPASPARDLYDHERPRPRRRPAPDWGGDELFDAVPRRRFARVEDVEVQAEAEPALERTPELDAPAPVRHLRVVEDAELVSTAPPARRTVTITGHPGRSASLERPRARTMEQRIHTRPASFAAWAFALGLLLIVIAIATSG
jgi:hypothetical protein